MNRKFRVRLWAALALGAASLDPVSAQTLELRPLGQSHVISIGAAGTYTLPFEVVGGGTLDIQVLTGADIGVAVKLPDGSVVTRANAASFNAAIETPPSLGEYDYLIHAGGATIFRMSNPPAGRYELAVTSATALGSTLVRVSGASGAIRSAFDFGPSGFTIPAGMSVPVTVVLADGAAPLLNATMAGEMRTIEGGFVANWILNDRGIAPDPTAGDGFYTGYVTLPAQGPHYLTVHISGTSISGKPYTGREGGRVVGMAPDILLTRSYSDSGVDTDGDGFFDHVAIEFDTTGPRHAGSYYVHVFLSAASGKQIDSSTGIADPGQPITAIIPAEKLKTLGEDGPWQISIVTLHHESTLSGLGHWNDLGPTQPYTLAQLERRNTLVKGILSDSGSDLDGDGLFDRLNIAVDVDVLLPGNYGISADLRAPDGALIEDAGLPSISLARGSNSVPLSFTGALIGASGADGPYSLTNVLVYPLFKARASTLTPLVGQTGAYRCVEFNGCTTADPLVLLDRLTGLTQAVPLNKGLSNSLLSKLRAARAQLVMGTPNAAKAATNILRAYSREIDAQRDKSVSRHEADMLIEGVRQIISMLER